MKKISRNRLYVSKKLYKRYLGKYLSHCQISNFKRRTQELHSYCNYFCSLYFVLFRHWAKVCWDPGKKILFLKRKFRSKSWSTLQPTCFSIRKICNLKQFRKKKLWALDFSFLNEKYLILNFSWVEFVA